VKVIMPGLAGPDWDGHIVGWAPGHVTEIPDDNPKAVAWARGWLEAGATLVEDTPKPKEPEKPAKVEAEPEAKPTRTYTRRSSGE
jgi:hypothetical protein